MVQVKILNLIYNNNVCNLVFMDDIEPPRVGNRTVPQQRPKSSDIQVAK